MVLLRHTLPDGIEHYDWLFEGAEEGTGLIAFRVSERLDLLDSAAFVAEAIPDHRREYLAYEGAVAGGRGRVVRAAEGRSVLRFRTDRSITVDQNWGPGWHRLTGAPLGGGPNWRFLSTRLGWRDGASAGML
jgi:hypothetical protein